MFSRKVLRLSNRDRQSTDCTGNSAIEGGQANRKGRQGDNMRHKENFFFFPPSVAEDRKPSELFWKMCPGKGEKCNLRQRSVELHQGEGFMVQPTGKRPPGMWLMDIPPKKKENACSLSLRG